MINDFLNLCEKYKIYPSGRLRIVDGDYDDLKITVESRVDCAPTTDTYGPFIVFDSTPKIDRREWEPQKLNIQVGTFQEFQSPIDGSRIASSKQLRDHEKAHGVRQVGNDLKNKGHKEKTRKESIKHQQGA